MFVATRRAATASPDLAPFPAVGGVPSSGGGRRLGDRVGSGLGDRVRGRLRHRRRAWLGDRGWARLGDRHRSRIDLGAGAAGVGAELALELVERLADLDQPLAALGLGPLADPLRVGLGLADDRRRPLLGVGDHLAHPLGDVVNDLLRVHTHEITC